MNTLDLHGVKHSDVQTILDQFLWENMKKNEKEVSIITGISDQMKRIVKECISDYNMLYVDDFLNPGKIIIKLV
jgi:DNA-nicking Smr family endonuclease